MHILCYLKKYFIINIYYKMDIDIIDFFEKIPKKKTDIVFFDIDDTLSSSDLIILHLLLLISLYLFVAQC